jgi:hypothetical protein
LEAQVAGLRSAMQEFRYVGQWTERQYNAGNLVGLGGAIYHCDIDTAARPGTDNKSWSLVCPRARDGKDGRDGRDAQPEPPEPRTTRSHR